MTSTRAVRLTLAACLVAAPALAQTDSPRVSDLLAPGQTIEVIDDQGRETKGRVEAFPDRVRGSRGESIVGLSSPRRLEWNRVTNVN